MAVVFPLIISDSLRSSVARSHQRHSCGCAMRHALHEGAALPGLNLPEASEVLVALLSMSTYLTFYHATQESHG